ncbi:lytic transglycosylase domain-containing protein [Thalassococcus sp. BH17M4-6]|uniref:lytic transglycosylase domain-containing protein n=1 Tax=Thalassococcus sp. BH17M4-6 TaxID=3413148 RepID=UPI003BBA8DB5
MHHLPLLAALLAALACQGAKADAPLVLAEISAKRIKVPQPGTKKRITVQIAPRANPAVPPLPDTPAKRPATPGGTDTAKATPGRARGAGSYDWFWQAVSPRLDATGPGRLEPALVSLKNPPQGKTVAAPRLQHLQDIAAAQGIEILKATIGTRVSPAFVLSVMAVESGGRVDAVSKAGAQGLMQLMPATAERFGVTDSLNPAQNIKGGVAFLDFLMEKFDGDPILVLAGYNAGENAIAPAGGVPDYAETRDYVPKVLAAFDTAKGLCLTPPQLISDGCVFRVSKR